MREDMLSRRQILALAGAALTAGCSGQGGPGDGTAARFARGNSNDSERTTAVPTATTEEEDRDILNVQETTTERETERGERTRTERDTPERTETPTASENIEAARQRLADSVAAYTEIDDVRSIDELRASKTAFDAAAVREELSAAKRELDSAAAYEDVDESTVETLRAARGAMEKLVDCQVAVIAAYEHFDTASTAIFDEEFDDASDALSSLESDREDASDAFETLSDSTTTADFTVIEGITERELDRKFTQFSDEIAGFEKLRPTLAEFNEGIQNFADGVDRYLGKDWRGAERKLLAGLTGFENTSIDLIGFRPPGALKNTTETLDSASSALDEGTGDLIDSARAGRNRNDQDRQTELSDAKNGYQRSGAVVNLPSYQKLNEGT